MKHEDVARLAQMAVSSERIHRINIAHKVRLQAISYFIHAINSSASDIALKRAEYINAIDSFFKEIAESGQDGSNEGKQELLCS